MHNIIKRITASVVGTVMLSVTAAGSCLFSSAVVNENKYPVMGVDVSNYQGDICWKDFEQQNVSFAFIKATEGSGFIDGSAAYNLSESAKTDIIVSAYHFFSFDSPGETQAENYISVVRPEDIDMPPVVDIEYYGNKKDNKPSAEETEKILRPLLEKLEQHYGVKPIIYTTLPVYNRYIKDVFSDSYPLWIRNIWCEPQLIDWKFWQYSDHGELYGFNGEEKYIDLNVYNGSEEEFRREFQ